MNRSLPLLLFVTIILTGTLNAQNNPGAAPVAEPHYINVFYAVDTNGKLTALDHETVTTFRAKTKALPGYATSKVFAEIKPGHASVRLPAGARFIVLGRSQFDPSSRYELRLLKVSKDRREILMTQAHGSIVSATATSMDEGALPVRFEEYGVNSYRITPDQPLAPGEYALELRGVVTELYCFGVDR